MRRSKLNTRRYTLQIPIAPVLREALYEVLHIERKELQELIPEWLLEKLKAHPASQHLVHDLTLEDVRRWRR